MYRDEYTEWTREQERQQEYFDSVDKFDEVQEELNILAAREAKKNIQKKIVLTALTEKPRDAEYSLLTERQRALNLAKWILKSET
jgi:hypothetical protein